MRSDCRHGKRFFCWVLFGGVPRDKSSSAKRRGGGERAWFVTAGQSGLARRRGRKLARQASNENRMRSGANNLWQQRGGYCRILYPASRRFAAGCLQLGDGSDRRRPTLNRNKQRKCQLQKSFQVKSSTFELEIMKIFIHCKALKEKKKGIIESNSEQNKQTMKCECGNDTVICGPKKPKTFQRIELLRGVC